MVMVMGKNNNVVTEIAPCGLLCSRCDVFQKGLCEGCYNENLKVVKKCPVCGETPFEESLALISCMNQKGVEMCSKCTEFDTCQIYSNMLIRCPYSRPVYDLSLGITHLIKEEKPNHGYKVFTDLVKHGVSGLCLSRQHPKNLTNRAGWKDVTIYWLTSLEGKSNINPTDLGIMSEVIVQFLRDVRDGVIFIDGLELLFTNNDFPSVLRMINHVKEQVMQLNGRLILTLDERTLDVREMAHLEKNCEVFKQK